MPATIINRQYATIIGKATLDRIAAKAQRKIDAACAAVDSLDLSPTSEDFALELDSDLDLELCNAFDEPCLHCDANEAAAGLAGLCGNCFHRCG
jgi:hypothetical protein